MTPQALFPISYSIAIALYSPILTIKPPRPRYPSFPICTSGFIGQPIFPVPYLDACTDPTTYVFRAHIAEFLFRALSLVGACLLFSSFPELLVRVGLITIGEADPFSSSPRDASTFLLCLLARPLRIRVLLFSSRCKSSGFQPRWSIFVIAARVFEEIDSDPLPCFLIFSC